MSDTVDTDLQDSHCKHPESEESQPRGGSTLGWIFVVGAIVALVYIPAVLTGDQGDHRGAVLTDVFHTTEWDQIDVTGGFGVTPAHQVTDVGGYGVQLQVQVGHNPGAGNTYQPHWCDQIDADLRSDGTLLVSVPESNTCTQGPDNPAFTGWCCASQQGYADDDFVMMIATAPGLLTQEASVPTTPPYVPTTIPMAPGGHISSTMEYLINLYLGSSYNTGTGQVDFYTRPPGGPWSPLTSVTCDGPFAGDHW